MEFNNAINKSIPATETSLEITAYTHLDRAETQSCDIAQALINDTMHADFLFIKYFNDK